MELINQHTKAIMEGCKERARAAGLSFDDETLEYIVSNRDLIELSPKVMIPTLYDYWVHDVEVMKEKGRYELYPSNPYETVINTRPAVSFYNDNNPDWLNVMIFYHVLAHIDFFQNNIFFRHTWDFDFMSQALSDKRLIARLRAEHGRFVDYVIEFSRSIDNLVGFYDDLGALWRQDAAAKISLLDYYFDVFLQSGDTAKSSFYLQELARYNDCVRQHGEETGGTIFFAEVFSKHPELETLYRQYLDKKVPKRLDLLQYIMENSEFVNREKNLWMKTVMQVVRKTSLVFQPQIRTKIMNEGWASYWHETLFLEDDRIRGHEVDFARVNAYVTSMPRVGLNPYALGMRLFHFVEHECDKGRRSMAYKMLDDREVRKKFDSGAPGGGREFLFWLRENLSDFGFVNTFVDQDFVDHYRLFVAGKRLNQERMSWQYFVKSRKASDYKQMLVDGLYHPPVIEVDEDKTSHHQLYLKHRFEGKALVKDFIASTMMGIEYLWGGAVQLATHEMVAPGRPKQPDFSFGRAPAKTDTAEKKPPVWRQVLYTMSDKKLVKKPIV